MPGNRALDLMVLQKNWGSFFDSNSFADYLSVRIGERKDFEVYSCDVSPDGKRLVTAAGGEKRL